MTWDREPCRLQCAAWESPEAQCFEDAHHWTGVGAMRFPVCCRHAEDVTLAQMEADLLDKRVEP